MKLRILKREDAVSFQELRLRGLRECPSAFASSYEEECERSLEAIAERLETRERSIVFGAFEGEELVGVVGLRREDKLKLAHKTWLWGMYVAPEFRGRGAGRELVREALRCAGGMGGVRLVYLGVNAANEAARRLYEATGFREYGREPACMIVDGELQDEVYMACHLGGGSNSR